MRFQKFKYIMALAVIALLLWSLITESDYNSDTKLSVIESFMFVEVVKCSSGNLCLFNITGEKGILAKQVSIYINGYNAPRIENAGCRIEKERGKRAASWLMGRLRNSNFVVIMGAYKRTGSSVIEGQLLVNGHDIADWIIRTGLAVPVGIKVDWCEESPRTMEI